jgi:hypothetical protein
MKSRSLQLPPAGSFLPRGQGGRRARGLFPKPNWSARRSPPPCTRKVTWSLRSKHSLAPQRCCWAGVIREREAAKQSNRQQFWLKSNLSLPSVVTYPLQPRRSEHPSCHTVRTSRCQISALPVFFFLVFLLCRPQRSTTSTLLWRPLPSSRCPPLPSSSCIPSFTEKPTVSRLDQSSRSFFLPTRWPPRPTRSVYSLFPRALPLLANTTISPFP